MKRTTPEKEAAADAIERGDHLARNTSTVETAGEVATSVEGGDHRGRGER